MKYHFTQRKQSTQIKQNEGKIHQDDDNAHSFMHYHPKIPFAKCTSVSTKGIPTETKCNYIEY